MDETSVGSTIARTRFVLTIVSPYTVRESFHSIEVQFV